MSKYLVEESTLTDIADAIREQTGDSEPIQLSSFANAISGISGGSHSYSTDEQEVGTWIDGSPVYEKTFTGTISGNQCVISHGITNLNIVTSFEQTIFNITSGASKKAYYNVWANSTELHCDDASSDNGKTWICTIRYTKASANLLSMNSTESEGSENE